MGRYNLSDSEYEIMEIIWGAEKTLSFGEILKELTRLKGTFILRQTLRTQIIRLIDKGVLQSEKIDGRLIYSPSKSKEKHIQSCTVKMLADSYDGSIGNLIMALSGGEKLDEETIRELRKFIEE